MLTQLCLRNFAIVEQLTLELTAGMTAITGETGAGKSIIIDALDLVLGGRGHTNIIRHGAARAEISAIFNLSDIPVAQQWLAKHDFSEQADEVLLRRNITKEGRSRHFINDEPCTQQQIRHFGELLLNIHGQHEHQQLLQPIKQCAMLDAYAQHDALLQQTKHYYQKIQQVKQQLATLQTNDSEKNAKLALLEYQVKELQEVSLAENEISELEIEYKQLAHATQLRASIQKALTILDEHEAQTATSLITTAQAELNNIIHLAPQLQPTVELLNSIVIQLQESNRELSHYIDAIEFNPERLIVVEQRLNQIHDLARKHHVAPEELLSTQQTLEQRLNQLQHTDQYHTELATQLDHLIKNYQAITTTLSGSRVKAVKTLNQLVTANMQMLGMKGGEFAVKLTPLNDDKFSIQGTERIEFLVTTNPGQPLQPLHKVASGGEMSRISLALQMVTAQKDQTPTLIFDEVDVGIGGATAEIVGKLLQQLGKKTQVLCITHLPQVAAQANQHLQVQKTTVAQQTCATISPLNKQLRVEEIARMLGGVNITEQTLKHAQEMLVQHNC